MIVTSARHLRITAFAASLAVAAAPVAAAPLPIRASGGPFAGDDMVLHHSRHHDRHDGGIDTGDVIAGILAIGGIAVLASAAGRDRNEPRRTPQWARYDQPAATSSGLGRAVDMCVADAERSGERVASVEDAQRDASGWRVTGVRSGGARFSCTIGNDGRISNLDDRAANGARYVPAYGPAYAAGDRQYSDAVYARLWAGVRENGVAATASDGSASNYPSSNYPASDYADSDDRANEGSAGAQPAYPGGPFPGEDGYDQYLAGNGRAGS